MEAGHDKGWNQPGSPFMQGVEEGSCGLFSHGTWDMNCASNVPKPNASELWFHCPTSTSVSSCNYTQLVFSSPCIRYSKDKWKVTLESKDTKAQENETSYHVLISALTLPFPASYLEYSLSKEARGSLQVTYFFKNWAFNLYRSIVYLQYCINISCMGNQYPSTYTCIYSFLDS